VQSTLEDWKKNAPQHPSSPWNETIFLKTLKTLIQDGDVEQCTPSNCGLSPEFKKRVTSKAKQLAPPQPPPLCGLTYPYFTDHTHNAEEKGLPTKKPEHYKLKIIPKKIYDLQQ
jgi:hypothetical protein